MAAACMSPCSFTARLYSGNESLKPQGAMPASSATCQLSTNTAGLGSSWAHLGSVSSSSRGTSLYSLLEPSLDLCRPAEWQVLRITNVGWDPEGVLGAPVVGHIARRSMQKSLAQEEAEKQAEDRRRVAAREARVVPDTDEGLIDFLLETEVGEIKYEVARCRPRLTESFLSSLRSEMGRIRFAPVQTDVDQNRLAELEALEPVLTKQVEEYDMMASEFLNRKDVLQSILVAKDKRACLLELAAQGRLDPPLLALLDHNIASARGSNEQKMAEFMQKLRAGVVKYMTV